MTKRSGHVTDSLRIKNMEQLCGHREGHVGTKGPVRGEAGSQSVWWGISS